MRCTVSVRNPRPVANSSLFCEFSSRISAASTTSSAVTWLRITDKRQVQVQAGGDRQVDGPQRGHALELRLDLLLGLFVTRGSPGPPRPPDPAVACTRRASNQRRIPAWRRGVLERDRLVLALDLYQGGAQARCEITRAARLPAAARSVPQPRRIMSKRACSPCSPAARHRCPV